MVDFAELKNCCLKVSLSVGIDVLHFFDQAKLEMGYSKSPTAFTIITFSGKIVDRLM